MLSLLLAGLLLAAVATAAAGPSDEELMLRYQRGEVVAFNLLFERYQGPLVRFVRQRTGSSSRAEELTQEIFFRVVRRAPAYEPTARFRTWLYTIARNICIDESRRPERGRVSSLDEPISEDGTTTRGDAVRDTTVRPADDEPIRGQFRVKLLAELEKLPPEQREVFELRVFAELRFPEIAQMLGLPLETVKARYRYGCQRLRASLSEYGDFHFKDDSDDEGHHG